MHAQRLLRRVQPTTLLRPFRQTRQQRNAHDSHHDAHSQPAGTNESFGRGFYISLALVPTMILLFKFTAPDGTAEQRPYLTRLIGSLDRWRGDLAQREDLHTRTIEQAARDKNLFLNSPDIRAPPMRYPEELNSGSPYNVPAGQGRGNYEKAVAKYKREAYALNEEKIQALRNGSIKVEQPVDLSHRTLPV